MALIDFGKDQALEIKVRKLTEELTEKGFIVCRGLVPEDLCGKLARELTENLEAGEFSFAGIGDDNSRHINKDIRNDKIKWWDLDNLSPAQKQYFEILGILRKELAEHFYMPLTEYEIFYASYPEGGFYKKHVDNFEGKSRRLITAVLYLNEGWILSNGGHLKIWPRQKDSEPVLVEPEFGTLACFITPETAHEVLSTSTRRKSVVCWLGSRNDPVKYRIKS